MSLFFKKFLLAGVLLAVAMPAAAATITLDSITNPELFLDRALYSGGTIGAAQLQVDYGVSPLMKFDLATAGLPIGPNIVIDSAVYSAGAGYGSITNQVTGVPQSSDVTVYLVTRPWTGDVTWATYDGTNSWGVLGATGTGVDADYLTTNSTVVTFPGTASEMWSERFSLDITVSVQAWADGSVTNNGIILPYTSATSPHQYAGWTTSQQAYTNHGYDGTAPKLEISYHVVPEPATMSLLGIGGLAMLIRRKRK